MNLEKDLEFCINEEDLAMAMLYYNVDKHNLKKPINLTWFLGPAVFMAIAFFLYFFTRKTYLIPILIAASIILLLKFPKEKRRISTNFSSVLNKKSFENILNKSFTLKLEENSLHKISENSREENEYSQIEKIIELKRIYLIYLKKGQYFFIPKYQIEREGLKNFMENLELRSGLKVEKQLEWEW